MYVLCPRAHATTVLRYPLPKSLPSGEGLAIFDDMYVLCPRAHATTALRYPLPKSLPSG